MGNKGFPCGTHDTYQYECGVFPSLGTQGFGVAAKSTQECRHADPTAVVAFHQTDIGEYLRSEEMLI